MRHSVYFLASLADLAALGFLKYDDSMKLRAVIQNCTANNNGGEDGRRQTRKADSTAQGNRGADSAGTQPR